MFEGAQAFLPITPKGQEYLQKGGTRGPIDLTKETVANGFFVFFQFSAVLLPMFSYIMTGLFD